ncbi:translocation/assembly module TamB domain-containing protein [Glaciimonas sp. GNP009]
MTKAIASNTDQSATPNPAPPASGKNGGGRSGFVRRIAALMLTLLLILVLMICALFIGLRTESGTKAIWNTATWLSQKHLSGELAGGTVAEGVRLKNVVYRDATQEFTINKIDGSWRLTFSPLKFSINYLHIGTVAARMQPTPSEPMVLPTRLTLPLALSLDSITLDKLALTEGLSTTEYRNLSLHGQSDGTQHTLVLERLDTAFGSANGTVHLQGTKPFSISGGAELKGAYEQEKYQIVAKVSGTLSDLNLALQGNGDKLRATAEIAATPFAPIPFERVRISATHINPKLFSAGAPLADLNIQADLTPISPPEAVDGVPAKTNISGSKVDLALLAVSGPLHISNAIPGALDKDRLPLISVDAQLRLDAKTQQLSGLKIKLLDKGLISGAGEYHADGKEKNTGNFTFDVADLDLHALHGKLQTSQLQGPISVTLTPDTQVIGLTLADKNFSAKMDAVIDPKKIDLRLAELVAGPAHLNLSGTVDRTNGMAYTMKGKLRDFDPALWIKSSSPAAKKSDKKFEKQPHIKSSYVKTAKPVSASINMDINAAGKLAPTLQLKLAFNILDSVYDHLPMTGKGVINLLDKRLLPSEAQISVAGNNAQLKGNFGVPGDHFNFKVDAPELQRLGFGLSGALNTEGQVSGSIQKPVVKATYRAEKLVFGAQQIDSLSGQADIQADLSAKVSAATNRLQVSIEAHGYRGPDIALSKMNASLSGTFGDHSLKLDTVGTVRDKPLALTLAAQGKVIQNATGYGWQGTLGELKNQGIPRVSLDTPLSISVAGDKIILGATRLTIADAVIDLKNLSIDHGRIQSAGAVNALNVKTVVDLVHEFTGTAPPLKTDLVLDSRWDFGLSDSATGFVEINRRSGDIRVTSGRGDIPLGLTELRLRADLQGTQVNVNTALSAAKIGSVNAQVKLGLNRIGNGLMITDNASLSGAVKASVPQLKTFGSLIGPQVGLDGNLKMELKLDGVLGQPTLSGTVAGDNLAVTLYDQGIKLRDGIARFNVEKNVIALQQLEFHGGDGTLRANGQLQLGKSNPDVTATIVADRLQLFASPDRQLMLSGQAKVANVNEQLHVDGKFTIDKALFDLPKTSAPALGDDVVIVRNDGKTRSAPLTDKQKIAKTAEKPAGSLTPIMNIDVNFGNDFRFRGSGADLKLGGKMSVHSEPFAPLRASGTIRVTDGTYEVFGRKLAIERGLINFTGPLNNPNINILAMRRNQDVEAGAEISGYASSPRVKLVSEPNVSDEEKLSWLMFGHGSDSSALGQRQAAGQALAFLGNYGGKKIAQGVGLDEFSIGSSESGLVDEQVVNIGKAITEKINLGYEQGLTSAASVLKLTWQFSRRWSMVLRGGTINGLDVLFTKRFDSFWAEKKGKPPAEKPDVDF